MKKKERESAEEILKDPTGDIAKLRKMGITDSAIIRYITHVQEGQLKATASEALLAGRHLTPDQIKFVRGVLARFPLPRST